MTIREIVRIHESKGLHFFEPGTMRFFRSRLSAKVYDGPGGIYFVTSEQFVNGAIKDARAYTVRQFHPSDGSIITIGAHQAYPTLRAALAVARKLSEG